MANFLEEMRDHTAAAHQRHDLTHYLYSINGPRASIPGAAHMCARSSSSCSRRSTAERTRVRPECSENKKDTTLSLMIAHHRHRVQREQERYHPLPDDRPPRHHRHIAAIPLSPSSPPTTPSPRHPYLQNHPHRQSRRRALRRARPSPSPTTPRTAQPTVQPSRSPVFLGYLLHP